MRVGVRSDVGRVRRANEDAYWVSPPWYVVADGMGGHVAGEVASHLAIRAVQSVGSTEQRAAADQMILKAIRRANDAIWQRSQAEIALTGMGTTLTVARIEGGRCMIGHVGDSRCYLWRGGRLTQLTHDHSVVAELVRTGTLTEHEAQGHPQRNVLTRVLGMGPEVEPDLVEKAVLPGDKILLCTDGLSSVLSHAELGTMLADSAEPDTLAKRLVRKANERGGPDNITVLLVEVPAP